MRAAVWLISFIAVVFGQRHSSSPKHKSRGMRMFRFGPKNAFVSARSRDMKTKLLVGLLLGGSALFAATHVSIGIGVGGYGYAPPPAVAYAPAPPVVAYAPPCPGPGYTWVDGYWY